MFFSLFLDETLFCFFVFDGISGPYGEVFSLSLSLSLSLDLFSLYFVREGSSSKKVCRKMKERKKLVEKG